jgi:hypothetical protein
MGKSKDTKDTKDTKSINKTVNIGSKKRCSLSRFKGKGYIHLKNLFNGNHVSLDEEEFANLVKKSDKVVKLLAKLKSTSEKKKQKKTTKEAPSSADNSSSEASSGVESD